jgi:hypothetical protein
LKADPVLIFSSPKHHCTKAIDLVTGDTVATDCYAMRHRWSECGPDARLFEDAPPADPEKQTVVDPPTLEQGLSIGSIAALVLSALAILALIYWAYNHKTDQSSVIQTGEVTVKKVSVKDGSCCAVTARTRLLAKGGRWQVEVSSNDWRDCGDDCEKALRRALAEKPSTTASSTP